MSETSGSAPSTGPINPLCRDGCYLVELLGIFESGCQTEETSIAQARESARKRKELDDKAQALRDRIRMERMERLAAGEITERDFQRMEAADRTFREELQAGAAALSAPVPDPYAGSGVAEAKFNVFASEADRLACEAEITTIRKVIAGFEAQIGSAACSGPTGPSHEPIPLPSDPDYVGLVDNCGNRELADKVREAEKLGFLTLWEPTH